MLLDHQLAPQFAPEGIRAVIQHIRSPLHVLRDDHTGGIGVAIGDSAMDRGYAWLGTLPALYPEWLGDRSFQEVHGVRFPYIVGEMAGGIATADMVVAAAKAGLLGFFGAAGLPLSRVEQEIASIQTQLQGTGLPYGINLIHYPQDPQMEDRLVDLLLNYNVSRVSASAFMKITPAIVRYASRGLYVDQHGFVRRRNYVLAKLSRPEIARQFMAPAPRPILDDLVGRGQLTPAEAELASQIPLAEDITVEADSGGHTDNRPMTALFSSITALRNRLSESYGYDRPIRLGVGGGIGTPGGAAAAFSMGAAYIVTGSINQSAVEAGISKQAKEMLAQADLADVVMAPSSDMFELGIKVQVLRRGSLFHSRAAQLYELYRKYPSLTAIPRVEREKIEKEIFRNKLETVWADTKSFFQQRDPGQIEKARQDEKHRMALVFRWYVGNASKWAIQGAQDRQQDFQIWCGPAMGAFNAWVEGTWLAPLENRTVAQIAYNVMEGAAVITRAHQLRAYGVSVPFDAFDFRPRQFRIGG